MKHELNITKGEWSYEPNSIGKDFDILTNDRWLKGSQWVCSTVSVASHFKTIEQTESDVILICDAGNTYQSCGYLPSELLKQRDELKKALSNTLLNLEERVKGVEHRDWFKRTFAKEIETLKKCE